jgi:hypothetical protein
MPDVQLDLRRLEPGQAPRPEDVAAAVDAEALRVRGPVAGLAAALTVLLKARRTALVPVAWEPAGDKASLALARDIGVGTGEPRELCLVRDDHGGVLLHHGRVEADGEQTRRRLTRRFGARAYHDDQKVAEGQITRIDVRPDWRAVDTIGVVVMTLPLRSRRTTGRALQLASDPVRVLRDGVPYQRAVSRWTWYADDRVRWRLQP